MMKLDETLFARLNAEQWVGNQQPVVYGKGGLSFGEISSIEHQLGFDMPEDFRFLLQNMVDPGGVFFRWADFSKQKYDSIVAWVQQGIEFDIEHNGLWLRRWGARPRDLSAAFDIFRTDFANWPKLLPLSGHRFLIAEPRWADNPVFSIVQTDIVYYGANLAHYLTVEFLHGDRKFHTYDQNLRKIAIWGEFVDDRDNLLA